MDITKFLISNEQYIKVHFEQLKKVYSTVCISCFQVDVDYIDEKNNYHIRFGYDAVQNICYFIRQSSQIQSLLREQSKLSNKIADLGFELNQFTAGKQAYNEDFKYLWLSNDHKQVPPYYNSWMYNDKKGNIIFEITPFYPWFDESEKKYSKKIPYEEWIKNYKSIVKVIIPLQRLEEWMLQAKKMSEALEKYKQQVCC